MAPDYAAAEAESDWGQQVRATQLVVFLRREPGDDEVAVFAKDEEPIGVLRHESGSFNRAAAVTILAVHRFRCAPEPFAGRDADCPKDAVAVDAIRHAVLNERSTADRGQSDRWRALPGARDRRLGGVEFQSHRDAVVSAGEEEVAIRAGGHD